MAILQMLVVCHLFFMHTGYSIKVHKEFPSAVLVIQRPCRYWRLYFILFSPLSFGRHFSVLPSMQLISYLCILKKKWNTLQILLYYFTNNSTFAWQFYVSSVKCDFYFKFYIYSWPLNCFILKSLVESYHKGRTSYGFRN